MPDKNAFCDRRGKRSFDPVIRSDIIQHSIREPQLLARGVRGLQRNRAVWLETPDKMRKSVLMLAALVANSSAFSPTTLAGLQPKGLAAACNVRVALRPRHAVPSLTKLKAQEVSPDEVCDVETGNVEDCTASNAFKRKDGSDMTKLEKEQLYLDCCASWNVDKKPLLSDDDFEALK